MSFLRSAFYVATTAFAFGLGNGVMAQSPTTGGSHMEAVHDVQMSATPLRVDPDRPWANDIEYMKDQDAAYFRSAQRIMDVYIQQDVGLAASGAFLAKDIQTGIRTRTAADQPYKLNPTNMTTFMLPDLMGASSVPQAGHNLRTVTLSGNAQKKLLIEMKRLNDALYRIEKRYEKNYKKADEESAAKAAAEEAVKPAPAAEQVSPAATVEASVDSMAIYNAMAAKYIAQTPVVSVPADTATTKVVVVPAATAAEVNVVQDTVPVAAVEAPVLYDALTTAKLRTTYEQGVLTAVKTGKEPRSLSAASLETYGDDIVHQQPSAAFIKKVRAAYEVAQINAVRTGRDVSEVSTYYATQFGVSENTPAFKDGRLKQACANATAQAAKQGKPVSAVVLSFQQGK